MAAVVSWSVMRLACACVCAAQHCTQPLFWLKSTACACVVFVFLCGHLKRSTACFARWDTVVPAFTFKREQPMYALTVPTVDTCRSVIEGGSRCVDSRAAVFLDRSGNGLVSQTLSSTKHNSSVFCAAQIGNCCFVWQVWQPAAELPGGRQAGVAAGCVRSWQERRHQGWCDEGGCADVGRILSSLSWSI